MNLRFRARGFTLLEVLVALVIVAFGMGALMATLTSAADSVIHLRDKSFAEWIALNRISEVRLQGTPPQVGKVNGTIDFGGARWTWAQEVQKTALGDMLRIDVSVARVAASGEQSQAQLAMASGFFGTALTQTDGKDPDWSGFTLQQDPQSNPDGTGTPAPGPPSGPNPVTRPPRDSGAGRQ